MFLGIPYHWRAYVWSSGQGTSSFITPKPLTARGGTVPRRVHSERAYPPDGSRGSLRFGQRKSRKRVCLGSCLPRTDDVDPPLPCRRWAHRPQWREPNRSARTSSSPCARVPKSGPIPTGPRSQGYPDERPAHRGRRVDRLLHAGELLAVSAQLIDHLVEVPRVPVSPVLLDDEIDAR